MERVHFRRWGLECDPAATRTAYESVTRGAESCEESVCQNFAAARDRVYPREVRDVFQRLGIDRRKEAETFHVCRVGPKTLQVRRESGDRLPDSLLGLHLHGGWFHLIGSIVEGPDCFEPIVGPPKLGRRVVGRVALDPQSHRAVPGAGQGWTARLEPVSGTFSMGFTTHTALVPDSFGGHPIVQVEFEAFVPWVLPEPDSRELDA